MQKFRIQTDYQGYLETIYTCPECGKEISGRVSWYQAGKQKCPNCLTICVDMEMRCEFKEPNRIRNRILCDKSRSCKFKRLMPHHGVVINNPHLTQKGGESNV